MDDSHKDLSLYWFNSFMRRWPQLHIYQPKTLKAPRAKSASRETVDKYFDELNQIMEKYDLVSKPQNIFNVNEKGLCTGHKPQKVVITRNTNGQAVAGLRSQTITVMGGASVLGVAIPPYFASPGKRLMDGLMEGASPRLRGNVSDSGWSNTILFKDYLLNHLTNFLPGSGDTWNLCYMIDNDHMSTFPSLSGQRENKIILFNLPPHTSHIF